MWQNGSRLPFGGSAALLANVLNDANEDFAAGDIGSFSRRTMPIGLAISGELISMHLSSPLDTSASTPSFEIMPM